MQTPRLHSTPWGLTCFLCPSPHSLIPASSLTSSPTSYIPSLKISSHLHCEDCTETHKCLCIPPGTHTIITTTLYKWPLPSMTVTSTNHQRGQWCGYHCTKLQPCTTTNTPKRCARCQCVGAFKCVLFSIIYSFVLQYWPTVTMWWTPASFTHQWSQPQSSQLQPSPMMTTLNPSVLVPTWQPQSFQSQPSPMTTMCYPQPQHIDANWQPSLTMTTLNPSVLVPTWQPRSSQLQPSPMMTTTGYPQPQCIGANVAALPNDNNGLPLAPAYWPHMLPSESMFSFLPFFSFL